MTKNDLVLHLRAYGEEPPRSWTKVELRQRLHVLAEEGEVEIAKGGKVKTPYAEAVSAVNRASGKKANLVAYVQDTLKVQVSPSDTIGTLQKKALDHLLETIPGSGEDLMGFGKYSNKTYHQVFLEDKKYVEWAQTTAKEGPCSIYLDRFVNWTHTLPENDRKAKSPLVIGGKSGKTISKKAGQPTTPTPSLEKKGYETGNASSSTDPAVGQLTQLVKELMKEVKDLKEDKAMAVPRKVAARPDEDM